MKIAQIICQFRPYKSGMSEVAYNFSKELAKQGHEVVVFTPMYDKNLPESEEMAGFKVKRIKPLLKYGNAAFIPAIWKELNYFDIVHLHYPLFGAAEIVWIKNVFTKTLNLPSHQRRVGQMKLVITYHHEVVGEGIQKKFFKFYTKFLMPRILKSANLITVSSLDYFKNSKIYNKKLEQKITELPFGVDKDIYKPMPIDKHLLAKYNLEEDDKIILMIGGLDKAHYFKGLEYLIKAFKIVWTKHCLSAQAAIVSTTINKLKLIIVGEGDLKKYYINLAGQLGIRDKIIFAVRASDEEKIKFLNACYMEVLPSINKSEAFGLVLLEAMACAKPVIASNLPGVRTVVEDGVNGLLCEPKNESDLAGKIKYLLDNPLIARQMGGEGLNKVEEIYNWEKIGNRLLKIYGELKP